MIETKKRSIVKAFTYRFWQSFNMFLIALFVTKDYKIAVSIVSIEFFVKIFIYFLHERIWGKVKWGIAK